MNSPTPSYYKPIPFTAEHIEAKQAEVDAERAAYVAKQPKEVQERFAAVEKAVKILEEAKVSFQIFAMPDLKELVWQYNRPTYLDDPTSFEAKEQTVNFTWKIGMASIREFSYKLDLMIPICSKVDGKIYEVINPPENHDK